MGLNMRKRILTSFCAACLTVVATAPARAGIDPYIGEIMYVGFSFCPRGWAPLRGQILSIAQNTALFSLLGTRYGGNGNTTFALPNIPPVPTLTPGAVLTACIALEGIYPSRP